MACEVREDTEGGDAVLAAMACGDPDLDPIWGLLVDAAEEEESATLPPGPPVPDTAIVCEAREDTEDGDAVLAAMASGDPDLDPIWGLLVDAAEDEEEPETPPLVAPGPPSPDAAKACCPGGLASAVAGAIAGALVSEGDLAGVETAAGSSSDAAPASARSSSAASSGLIPAADGPARKPISAVVDKVEVLPASFPLPQLAPVEVSRWDVKGCDAFVLDGVLTPEECSCLIEQADGFWSFWDDSDCPRVTFRNACTVEVTHDELANRIWGRIAHLVPPSLTFEDEEDERFEVDIAGTWVSYGVNPTLLLSRYLDGGHFSPHTDGTTVVDFNRRTFYSSVLFLNESPWGGHTRIYENAQMRRELVPDSEGRLTGDPELVLEAVPPKAGRMLNFYHRLMHEGVPAAEKYIIRTDLLYRRTPERCTAPEDVEAFTMYQEAQLRAEKGECDLAADLFRRAFKRSEALREVYGMGDF